jgi:hypothetical protein
LVLAFVENDAVWAIAKIFDKDAAQEMADGQVSTEMVFIRRRDDGSLKVELEDSSTLLIEGALFVDHVALVAGQRQR